MKGLLQALAIPMLLALGACQISKPLGRAPPPPPDFAGGSGQLSGTAWRLVAFQSADDSIGTLRPGPEATYTLRFRVGGEAELQLDCNRGMARWQKVTNPEATGGQLVFEAVEVTNARCPAPSLSNQIAAQLPYVRSYSLRDGRLYMALFADGGIYEWEPLGPQ
jgi:heat shock protein HslJ